MWIQEKSTLFVVAAMLVVSTCAESRPGLFWRFLNGSKKACEKSELQCWSVFKVECYNPSLGEICSGGRVDCSSGFKRCKNRASNKLKCVKLNECRGERCGNGCYNPAAGESCTSSGVICRSGLRTCGKFCFNPEAQKCYLNKLVCKNEEEPCFGIRCYNPNKGQKCYNGGQVCNRGELPGPGRSCLIQTLF